jgi:phosphatidylglycerophosphate synthase
LSAGGGDLMADGASAGVRAESARRLLALTVNPGDRLWRYPLCHAVIGLALRTPLTPNHVTIGHTLLGMTAGALISTGRPSMLVAAGALYEFRSVLDCFDGVLARARGTASPYGRAMDQAGDFLGFAAFIAGSWVAFSRTLGFGRAMALTITAAGLSALCTFCWDFYKRRFTSVLLDGRDEVDETYVKVHLELRANPGATIRFSAWFARVQMLLLNPSAVPGLRARVASGGAEVAPGATHAAAERLRAMAAADDPALRSTLLRVGFSGGDTAIFILTFATLLTRPLEGFLAASAYCVVILAATVPASNRLLRAQPMTDSPH